MIARPGRVAVAAVTILFASLPAAPARACASCDGGDPTLTVLGAETPFAQRLRLGARLSLQQLSAGAPEVDQLIAREQRLEVAALWAPLARLLVSATLPLVRRELSYVGGERKLAQGTGDLELRAKAFVWRDRPFAPRQLLSFTAGARLPTSPWARDGDGPLPVEQQLGNGAVSPLLGAAYAYVHFPWSASATVEGQRPVRHRTGDRLGGVVRGSTAVQRQLTPLWALRLAADLRDEGRSQEDGSLDPDSGGVSAALAPTLLVTPGTDVLIFAEARWPIAERLNGRQESGPVFATGVVYDF